jgi:hypothetical protein
MDMPKSVGVVGIVLLAGVADSILRSHLPTLRALPLAAFKSRDA